MFVRIRDGAVEFIKDMVYRWQAKNGRTSIPDIDAFYNSEYLNIGLKDTDGNYHEVIDEQKFMLAVMKYGFTYEIKK